MVIFDVQSGELLGSCGLRDVEGDRAEIGYWVKREARGRGVATRAVRLVTEWGLGQVGLSRIQLQADVRNLASQRVAHKAGYRWQGEGPAPERCADRCARVVRFVAARS